jgi:hypothetical protein
MEKKNWTYIVTPAFVSRFNEDRTILEIKKLDTDEWVQTTEPEAWNFVSVDGQIVPVDIALDTHKHLKERLIKRS